MEEQSISHPALYGLFNWSILIGGIFVAIYVWQWHRANPPSLRRCTGKLLLRSWSTGQVTALIGITLSVNILLSLFGARWAPENLETLVQLIILAATYGSGLFIMQRINRSRRSSWQRGFGMGLRQLKMLQLSPVFYLAAVPFIYLVTVCFQWLLTHGFGLELTFQESVEKLAGESSWIDTVLVLAVVVGAPVYEELVFRGILFPYLLKRWGLRWSIVAISTIFAVIHWHIPSMASLFLLSVILCLTYWRFSSLWVSIGIHAIFNGMTTLLVKLFY